MFKIINFLFFAQKVSSGIGGITSQIFRGLAELEHPQDWGQRGSKFVFVFFIVYFHYLFI